MEILSGKAPEVLRKQLVLSMVGAMEAPELVDTHHLVCLADKMLDDQGLPRFGYDWTMRSFGPVSSGLTSTLKSLDWDDGLINLDERRIHLKRRVEFSTNPSIDFLSQVVDCIAPSRGINRTILKTSLASKLHWDSTGQIRF